MKGFQDPCGNQHVSYIRRIFKVIATVLMVALVCALLAFCFQHREQITADQIIRFTPKNQIVSVTFMCLLFALKSVCVFVYSGILYAASGMIFSVPVAMLVNILGTVVMTSIPYFIGKKAGSRYVEKMVEKHPKMAMLKEAQEENSFFLSFMVHIIGHLPSDLVSAFFGANGISYGKYILSTVLGFLPMITTFSIMGMSAHDVTSPAFLISALIQLGIMIFSSILYMLIRKKKRSTRHEQEREVWTTTGGSRQG